MEITARCSRKVAEKNSPESRGRAPCKLTGSAFSSKTFLLANFKLLDPKMLTLSASSAPLRRLVPGASGASCSEVLKLRLVFPALYALFLRRAAAQHHRACKDMFGGEAALEHLGSC